jgi:1-acyl-sn-glycerol-3-phosphate acyltransferase
VVYRLSRFLCRWFFRLVARVEVTGPQPPEGGVLIVANHVSHFDPPLLGACCPRPVDFMAMEELFRARWFAVWLKAVNAISTDRQSVDTTALRAAVRRLQAGRMVCIFPEGGLRSGAASVLGGAALPAGGAVLSGLAKVPVTPCLIVGPDQLYDWKSIFRRPRMLIRWGEMIPCRKNRDEMNNVIEAALRRMYSDWRASPQFDPAMEARPAQERVKKG